MAEISTKGKFPVIFVLTALVLAACGGRATPQMGQVFTAVEVDRNGCPLQSADTFTSSDTIYVGAGESRIPEGTEIFARLYREGQLFEDTDPIVADRDLENCVWFEFDPALYAFEPGQYEAAVMVNGESVGTTEFVVEEAGVVLGRVYSAASVDGGGCPDDVTDTFRVGESIYLTTDESDIPQGTQMFARLSQGNQVVEETDPILADRDMSACIWFEFDPSRSALEAGRYEAEIIINGTSAGSVSFDIEEASVTLGRVYSAASVDEGGCPQDATDTFNVGESIYLAADESDISQGAEMFARLSQGNQIVEETDPIVADRDMSACIWFEFDPSRSALEVGQYEAEIIVNGTSAASVTFDIEESNVDLGRVYSAASVDEGGCPQDVTDVFRVGESIYIAADESDIPRGTELFARLSQGNQVIEETDPIVADRDMSTCIWFEFDPSRSALDAGRYEAEIIVDGTSAGSVTFDIEESNVDLGRVYSALSVDEDGCPDRVTDVFRADEEIYVAVEESDLPRGTELFARLYPDGDLLEETDPIVADQDMQTCIWFNFSPARFDFESGDYEVEVVVDGSAADSVRFEIR